MIVPSVVEYPRNDIRFDHLGYQSRLLLRRILLHQKLGLLLRSARSLATLVDFTDYYLIDLSFTVKGR